MTETSRGKGVQSPSAGLQTGTSGAPVKVWEPPRSSGEGAAIPSREPGGCDEGLTWDAWDMVDRVGHEGDCLSEPRKGA